MWLKPVLFKWKLIMLWRDEELCFRWLFVTLLLLYLLKVCIRARIHQTKFALYTKPILVSRIRALQITFSWINIKCKYTSHYIILCFFLGWTELSIATHFHTELTISIRLKLDWKYFKDLQNNSSKFVE